MTPARRTLVGIAAALVLGAALVGAEVGRGALVLGRYATPNPCTQETPIRDAGVTTELQRIALDGLARAACRLRTTRVKLALALGDPAKRRRIAHGRDLNEVFRAGLLQAVSEQQASGRLGTIQAFLYREAIAHAPLSLVEGVLGL